MSHHHNITRIKAVYNGLGALQKDVVFVGGATVSLYSDREAVEVRPTEDIDILIELLSHLEYSKIDEQLRSIGFENDKESGVICRYQFQGTTVDVMPTDESVLGFTNIWYQEGFENAIDYIIDENHIIKIFSAPYFIASKFEAFKGRGNNDGRTSSDFEDIVFVFDNRKSIWEELNSAPENLRDYLKQELTSLLENKFHFEWIDSHVDFGSPPSSFFIIENIKKFISK